VPWDSGEETSRRLAHAATREHGELRLGPLRNAGTRQTGRPARHSTGPVRARSAGGWAGTAWQAHRAVSCPPTRSTNCSGTPLYDSSHAVPAHRHGGPDVPEAARRGALTTMRRAVYAACARYSTTARRAVIAAHSGGEAASPVFVGEGIGAQAVGWNCGASVGEGKGWEGLLGVTLGGKHRTTPLVESNQSTGAEVCGECIYIYRAGPSRTPCLDRSPGTALEPGWAKTLGHGPYGHLIRVPCPCAC